MAPDGSGACSVTVRCAGPGFVDALAEVGGDPGETVRARGSTRSMGQRMQAWCSSAESDQGIGGQTLQPAQRLLQLKRQWGLSVRLIGSPQVDGHVAVPPGGANL